MRIGIIAAMKEELSSFKSSLENIKTNKLGSLEYYTGTMNGHKVALILCGIGKVNATAGCTLLIDKHQPDLIINSGVAGGFSKNLSIGDIVQLCVFPGVQYGFFNTFHANNLGNKWSFG